MQKAKSHNRLSTSRILKALRTIESFKVDAERENWDAQTWVDRCRLELGPDAPLPRQTLRLVKEAGGLVRKAPRKAAGSRGDRLRFVARQLAAVADEMEAVCVGLGVPFNASGSIDREKLRSLANGRFGGAKATTPPVPELRLVEGGEARA